MKRQGTHPESWSELLVDLHYPPTQAIGHLWNTHVSRGVYLTFFDQFAALEGQVPYGACYPFHITSEGSSR